MKESTTRSWEDEEILRLLDDMATTTPEDSQDLAGGVSEAAEAVRRSCLEALATIPSTLEPVAPPAGLREQIIAQAEASRDVGVAQATPVKAHRGSPTWLLPAAATVSFLLVGVTGWQVWRVDRQADTIAHLSAELERARVDAAALAEARAMLAETRTRLEMITAASAEYCALRAPSESAIPDARGTLVMLRDRKDWFLKVEGLEPCERGRQYKVWFLTDAGPILGTSFAVKTKGDAVEIRSVGMPAGVKAVMITLEQPDVDQAPSEPAVLYGDERMQIL